MEDKLRGFLEHFAKVIALNGVDFEYSVFRQRNVG